MRISLPVIAGILAITSSQLGAQEAQNKSISIAIPQEQYEKLSKEDIETITRGLDIGFGGSISIPFVAGGAVS